MRTLLTGFGSFPGVDDNPTARIVEYFAAKDRRGALSTRVLPVSFQDTATLIPEVLRAEGPFDAALLLGVAARDHAFRLERLARNRSDSFTPDVDGCLSGFGAVVQGAPNIYETQAPLDTVKERIQLTGAPIVLSEDAGGYVCNHAYFTALHAIHQMGLPTLCLFLHVPPISTECPLERHIAVVETTLEGLRAAATEAAKTRKAHAQEVPCSER